MVVKFALDGNGLCRQAIEEVAAHLGTGIADMVHVFNPELVLIGGKAEIDEAARIVELDAALLHRPKIGDGAGKREGELLRLGAAGVATPRGSGGVS